MKLTQCGKDVDVDMYDKIYNWRTLSFSLDFESSPSYKKLIEWCFTAPITSPIVSGIIRSICIHEINPQPIPEHKRVKAKEAFEDQKIEDLALDVIAKTLQRMPAIKYIAHYEAAIKKSSRRTSTGAEKERTAKMRMRPAGSKR